MSLFLGIDSGTQSVKVVALDLEAGKTIAEARAPHRMIPGLPPGHLEQDPRMWIRAMGRAIAAVAAQIDGGRVRGIGVSGQQHGLVPLDAHGEVIRPAKLWCDTSTGAECAGLTEKLGGPKALLRLTGNLMLPGYTAPKILWLKRHEPRRYRRLRHVLLPHDYLNFFLTGDYTMERGDASGTALLDVRQRTWSKVAIDALDPALADWLPPLLDAHEPAGALRPALARRWGFSPRVVVSAGGGDNMMGAIGTGNVRPGLVSASFGTSGTIYGFAARAIVDPQGEIAAFCDSTGGWLPLVCTMNVTAVTERVGALFGYDHRALDRAVKSVPPGADGLVLLPYFAGERTPSVPGGTGVLFGLNGNTLSAAHLARAAMEGVTLGMNHGLRRLAELGVRAKEIRVTGGGARSAVWRQLMADIFGHPVVGMAEDEAAALGAALQAAWCVSRQDGRKTSLADLAARVVRVREKSRCHPRREHVARYREWQALQDKLGLDLRDAFAARAAIS